MSVALGLSVPFQDEWNAAGSPKAAVPLSVLEGEGGERGGEKGGLRQLSSPAERRIPYGIATRVTSDCLTGRSRVFLGVISYHPWYDRTIGGTIFRLRFRLKANKNVPRWYDVIPPKNNIMQSSL